MPLILNSVLYNGAVVVAPPIPNTVSPNVEIRVRERVTQRVTLRLKIWVAVKVEFERSVSASG